MIHVDSEAIADVEYRPRARRLLVRFTSGELYAYEGVPGALYEELLAAESKGRFFQAKVRGQYPYSRLS